MSPIVEQAFIKWVGTSTWYTGHPADEHRFYRFVWTVLRYSRKRIEESELREMIINTCTGQLDPDYLQNKARTYSGLYVTLLDFAVVRNGIN